MQLVLSACRVELEIVQRRTAPQSVAARDSSRQCTEAVHMLAPLTHSDAPEAGLRRDNFVVPERHYSLAKQFLHHAAENEQVAKCLSPQTFCHSQAVLYGIDPRLYR